MSLSIESHWLGNYYLRQWTPVDNLREAIFIRNKVTKQHQIKCCNLIFLSKTAANKVKNEVAFKLVNNRIRHNSKKSVEINRSYGL